MRALLLLSSCFRHFFSQQAEVSAALHSARGHGGRMDQEPIEAVERDISRMHAGIKAKMEDTMTRSLSERVELAMIKE